MPLKLKDWAEDETRRIELGKVLSTRVMQEALETLRHYNRPSSEIPKLIPGMTGMESIALINTQRAGGHGMIESLLAIPLLSNQGMQALSDPSFRSEPSEEMLRGVTAIKRKKIR